MPVRSPVACIMFACLHVTRTRVRRGRWLTIPCFALPDLSPYQHYTDLTCIGAGKFATVHRAQHTPTGLSVALKKVQVFMDIMETAERHQIVREAKLLQKVDHVHIIKCYDSWIEEGEFYVCLELCDRGDLSVIIKKQQDAGC